MRLSTCLQLIGHPIMASADNFIGKRLMGFVSA